MFGANVGSKVRTIGVATGVMTTGDSMEIVGIAITSGVVVYVCAADAGRVVGNDDCVIGQTVVYCTIVFVCTTSLARLAGH